MALEVCPIQENKLFANTSCCLKTVSGNKHIPFKGRTRMHCVCTRDTVCVSGRLLLEVAWTREPQQDNFWGREKLSKEFSGTRNNKLSRVTVYKQVFHHQLDCSQPQLRVLLPVWQRAQACFQRNPRPAASTYTSPLTSLTRLSHQESRWDSHRSSSSMAALVPPLLLPKSCDLSCWSCERTNLHRKACNSSDNASYLCRQDFLSRGTNHTAQRTRHVKMLSYNSS